MQRMCLYANVYACAWNIMVMFCYANIVNQLEIRDYIFPGTKRLVISLLLFGSIWKQACIASI